MSARGPHDDAPLPRPPRQRVLLACLAVLPLLVAGCLGPGAPDDGGDDGGPADARPLRLADAAPDSGLAGCGPVPDGPAGNASPHRGGRGAGWADVDDDGDPDLYVACEGPNRLYRNDGNGSFTELAAEAGVAGAGNSTGVAWGDADDDGCIDLYVANLGDDGTEGAEGEPNALYRNRCDGTFERVPAAGGASHAGDHSTSAAWADADHDGDLDLYVANRGVRTGDGRVAAEENRLYDNRGNMTFRDVAGEAGVAGAAAGPEEVTADPVRRGFSQSVVWLDYDKDGFPDLFVTDGAGVSPLYRNTGNGTFVEVTAEAGLEAFGRDRGVAVGDVDGDKDADLHVAREGADVLWENRHEDVDRRGTFDEVAAEAGVASPGPGWGNGLVDLDGDGDLDLVVAQGGGPGSGNGSGALVYRNDGGGRFSDVTGEALGAGQAPGLAVAVADADGDGARDAYVTDPAGPDRLLRNEGPQGSWIGIQLRGNSSLTNRSTPRGVGALVHLTVGEDEQVHEVRAGSGYLATDEPTVYAGLDEAQVVDTVQVFWPSGVRQVVHDIEPVNQTVVLEEEMTVKTSCPLLFGYTGDGFAFRSDVLGNAYMGWRTSPEPTYMPPDPNERIRFDDLEPRNGSYELRILEALEEINYLDEVELTAVDHPAGVEVLPDEAFNVEPPHRDLGLVQARDPRPVAGAWMDGQDVTDLVAEKDGRSPDVPRLPPPTWDGYAEDHALVLDLGDEVADAGTVQLLVDGWIYYPMVAPDRAVEGPYRPLEPPSIDAYDPGNDTWVPVDESPGFPAGLPKQMTVDLTGDLPDGATRIRLETNLQIHWDRIRVDTSPDDADVRVTSLDPGEAELDRKGYPVYEYNGPQDPGSYGYDRIADSHHWMTPVGNYTRYGDVTPLLQEADDRFVLFRHGDEVRIRFPTDALPEVPDGWERTLFVDLDGFFKDMEKYNAYPETVEPLPHHGMSNYPPGPDEPYPDDAEHRRYLDEWNTRRLGDLEPSLGPGSEWGPYIG